MKRRFLSILLILVLMVSIAPTASAVEPQAFTTVTIDGIVYRLYDTYASVYGYNGEPTDVVLASEVEGLPVTEIADDAFWMCSSLSTVTIPDSVTKIGMFAFSESGLIEILIPAGVTEINIGAFEACPNLTAIDVAAGNPTYWSVDGALYGKDMFWGEYRNILMQIPTKYTGTLTVPEGIYGMDEDAAYGCTGITQVYLPASWAHFDSNHFNGCTALSAIHVDENNELFHDKDGVLYGLDMMYDDDDNEVYVPAILAVPAAYPGPDFKIPEGVELVGSHAFNNCANIVNLYIPASVADCYTQNFDGCSNLTGIWVAEGNPTYISDEYGVVYNKECVYEEYIYDEATDTVEWIDVVYPDMSILHFFPTGLRGCYEIPEGVLRLAYDSFYCANIDGLILPTSLTKIVDYAMSYCENLDWLLFRGDLPSCGYNILAGVNATIHYPAENATWSDMDQVNDSFSSYPGTLAFEGYTTGNEPAPPCEMINPDVTNPFTDVAEGSFCYEPILWAVENNITSGMGNGTFAPNNQCTRGQVVTFLWRAAGQPEPTVTSHPFTDVKEGAYYYKAMLWAVENKITSGMTATTFGPDAVCNRGQVVTFLHRAKGKPAPTSTSHPFTDVNEKGFYYNAMLWAVENKITSGMSATTFAPDNACTRGQVVTFLYRAYAK